MKEHKGAGSVVGYSDLRGGMGGMFASPAMIIKWRGVWTYVQDSERHGHNCHCNEPCPRKRIKLELIRMKSNRLRPNKRELYLANRMISWETFSQYMETH